MNLEQRIHESFQASIETKAQALEVLPTLIVRASKMIIESFLANGKVLSCGSGSSAFISQHLVSLLMDRFEQDRPGLPALSLTGDGANNYSLSRNQPFEQVFASQVRSLGNEKDILLVCCSDGSCPSIIQAITEAQDRGIKIIALTGGDGDEVTNKLVAGDLEIRVSAKQAARIQEVHLLTIHCLCDLIDHQLFGGE